LFERSGDAHTKGPYEQDQTNTATIGRVRPHLRQVAAALNISKTTVSESAMYARDAGVDWSLASILGDDKLQARLYPSLRPRSTHRR